MSDHIAPGVMTAAGPYAALFEGLPTDVGELTRVAQGLLIHEFLAGEYGVTLTDEDRATVHVRPVRDLLAAVVARDDRPLTQTRPPADRVASNCRGFSVLMTAMLRAQGVAARARCGFGGYFPTDYWEDHWVCEYFDADQGRWVLVDAQLDDVQRKLFGIDFDPLDTPRDRFLVAGDAWVRCRSGADDPDRFGLSGLHEAGYWWIAGNLMRDLAALDDLELLPWDMWGAMPKPYGDVDEALFDRVAGATRGPDLVEARQLLTDDRLRVPDVVRNALRDTDEPVREPTSAP
ncbi:transglutaminase-like domain-containing protein [Krasilnikovia sp. MM14-A1004]|uniref:transglutaminase-like domain-containing protein n=1 Tax=Krasilnikovia sp. MM14-A1004 TaxID=3373541 RepID=UPI00399D2431